VADAPWSNPAAPLDVFRPTFIVVEFNNSLRDEVVWVTLVIKVVVKDRDCEPFVQMNHFAVCIWLRIVPRQENQISSQQLVEIDV
jgi:hypothetical protein